MVLRVMSRRFEGSVPEIRDRPGSRKLISKIIALEFV